MNQLKKIGILLIIGIIIILARQYEWKRTIQAPPDIAGQATLVRVVDGDTLIVDLDGVEERIRIIGIDTPESVKPNTPVQCFAKEATAHLTEILGQNEILTIETDPTQDTRDTYDRMLAHVFIGKENIAEVMIADGYAYEYTYDKPYIYQNKYKNAQSEARSAERGLWSPDTCSGQR